MMHSQSQVALEINATSSGTPLMYDGEYHFRSSASVAISSQKSGQKRTRQWAAWTRQEQENFFSALRQVGKNFEKITSRVQSKNKNQVRHYYYRLVRRMNKLLSPGFCLDAKNSKDTNAAMLRWWSLLEKYSCTPSKLYRKPRRFKIFIEALENQLLKDRNKAKRKRPCQGENYLETSSTSSLVRRFSEDVCAVKAVFSDPLNTPKLGTNKGALLKRNLTNADFCTGVLSPIKATAQKQRIGLVESAAYRRWEKAAMAGVALVADAAEQLERIASENCSFGQGSLALQNANCSFSVAGVCSHQVGAAVLQAREKLKLQLFPIDEDTRRMLEKDAHNPFLELTLSARKRISSVLEHLNRKWVLNTRGSTELLLLPYSIQQRDMEKCQRWSIKDADFTAADVHAAVGNPSVFRLRYGWFSGGKLVAGFSDSPRAPGFDNGLAEEFVATDRGIMACDSSKSNSTNICVSKTLEVSSSKDGPSPAAIASVEPTAQIDCLKPKGDLTESSGKSAFCIAELTKDSFAKQQDLADSTTSNNCSELLAVEWADSLTNISVGDLLLEASEVPSPQQNTLCIQQNPISCDSFDAAVAANSYRSQSTGLSAQAPIVSLWNAEETCDEFSFKKASALKAKVMNLCPNNLQESPISACNMNSSGFMDCCPEDLGESSSSDDPSPDEPEYVLRQNDEPVKDSLLTDLYWPDSLGSLGQLDLDLPFPRYVTQDLCFTGSVCHSSFNLMIGSSLDAFQSVSFLGNDRKDTDCADGDATVIDDRMITKE